MSGSVNLTSPQFNITGTISGLNSVAIDIPKIDRWGCQISSIHASVLARGSTGGIPVTEAQYSFIPPAIELDNRLPSNANLSEINQAITHNDNYACAPI